MEQVCVFLSLTMGSRSAVDFLHNLDLYILATVFGSAVY
jgi:hypothetical protein